MAAEGFMKIQILISHKKITNIPLEQHSFFSESLQIHQSLNLLQQNVNKWENWRVDFFDTKAAHRFFTIFYYWVNSKKYSKTL